MRGARPAPLQRPGEGLARIWCEAGDLFFTAALTLTLLVFAAAFDKTRLFAQDYAILSSGIIVYGLSRYQKKPDVFFLAVLAIVFMISSRKNDLFHGLSLVWAVSVGIVFFQTCFLGLRHKLLFSRLPVSMKGWPSLCLLAGFIALVLRSLGRLVF